MSTTCSQSWSQWKKSCGKNDYLDFKYKFLVRRGEKIASSISGITLAALQTLVQAEKLIPLPVIEQIDRDDQEAQYTEFGLGRKKVRMPAVRREFDRVLLPICSHKNLRTIDSNEWDIIMMDDIGNIAYYEFASDDLRGFAADIDVQDMDWENGYATPIHITFRSASQFDDNGNIVHVDFTGEDVVDLALEEVTLTTSGSPSATAIVVIVASICGGNSYPVEGLVAGDFTATTGTISQVTEAPAGTYTFVTSGLGTGTFGLKAPSSMTTKGYKGGNSLSITIT